jgi:hypothetical protein
MKTRIVLGLLAIASTQVFAQGARHHSPPPPRVQTSAPVIYAPAAPAPAPSGAFVYEQHPVQVPSFLVSAEQAQGIIDRFRAAYPKLNSPRFLIYVNRDLIDEKSGMRLTSRTQRTDASRSEVKTDFQDGTALAAQPATNNITVSPNGTVTVNAPGSLPSKGSLETRSEKAATEERYRFHERPQQTLADRHTLRDVERLFGRPLRAGGASLADQRLATQLMPERPVDAFTHSAESDAARKDREALAKIADVVLEVLISSRNVTVNTVSGERVHTVPDIQATAIRLSDSQILGQASATDVLGHSRIAQNFDVRQVAEATALALMEDMMVGVE